MRYWTNAATQRFVRIVFLKSLWNGETVYRTNGSWTAHRHDQQGSQSRSSIMRKGRYVRTCKCKVGPKNPINVNFAASDDVIKNFAHPTDVSLRSFENMDVDMLIGSNASDCFVIHDQRFEKPGEPYAQRFCFGWAVIGTLPQPR